MNNHMNIKMNIRIIKRMNNNSQKNTNNTNDINKNNNYENINYMDNNSNSNVPAAAMER